MAIDWQGLAALGLSVFALPVGSKAPANSGWTKYEERKPTEDEVAAWAADPSLNAGVVCGALSGVVVLVVKDEQLDAFGKALGDALAAAPSVRTRTGTHFYFAHPGFPVLRFRPDPKRPAGVDIQGDGRYAVAPGSVVDGHLYAWEEGRSPADLPFPPLPPEIVHSVDRAVR